MTLNPVKITDTTFRDAHQSLIATRLRTADMEPIATDMDSVGFHSVEVWGGATFDAATRFLAEDPWERLRTLKRLMPKTPLMMLLRGQALVGYRAYADDVVDAFVQRAAEVGVDVFRVFDALNDVRNLQRAAKAVKKSGKHLQLAVCYSVTEGGRLGGPIYNLDYFIEKATQLQEIGADSICLKDMGGLMAPYDAYDLVAALKPALKVPLQLHTHYTSGMASMTVLKAIEAGADIVDACLAPLALRTSQPAVEPLVVALKGTARDSGLDLDKLLRMGDYLESVLPRYQEHLQSPRSAVIDVKVLRHQIPGGMASNLVSQLREANALDRLDAVLEEVPRTRKELGYPPLVTPMSQIVGSQSVSNVLFGRYRLMSGEFKDYVLGLYGRPSAPIDPQVVDIALRDNDKERQPVSEKPVDCALPEMKKAGEAIKDISTDIEDVLTYALYPTTGLRFLRMKHGLEPIPQEMRKTRLPVEGKPWAKPLAVQATARTSRAPDSKHPRSRLFDVHVGGEHFQVEVEPAQPSPSIAVRGARSPAETRSPKAATGQPPPAAAQSEAEIAAPLPCIVLRYSVKVGQMVKEGDPVVVVEAMKMENTLRSPIAGRVRSLASQPGRTVAKDDILAIIAP